MRITEDFLKYAGACSSEQEEFAERFPEGIEVTKEEYEKFRAHAYWDDYRERFVMDSLEDLLTVEEREEVRRARDEQERTHDTSIIAVWNGREYCKGCLDVMAARAHAIIERVARYEYRPMLGLVMRIDDARGDASRQG